MADETDDEVIAKTALGVVEGVLDLARATYPEAVEHLVQQPTAAAFWAFLGWYQLCGNGRSVREALSDFVSIFEGAAAKMEPPAEGKAGRPTDEGVRLARVLKDAGTSRDDICATVVPGFAEMSHVERRRAWGQLRDRMRNQRKYEQRKGASAQGTAGPRSGAESATGARLRPRLVK